MPRFGKPSFCFQPIGKPEEKTVPQAQTEAKIQEKPKKAKKETKKEAKKETKKEGASLGGLSGVGDKILVSLKDAGIKSIEDIIKAKVEGLMKIKGIGEKKAAKIIAEAKKLN